MISWVYENKQIFPICVLVGVRFNDMGFVNPSEVSHSETYRSDPMVRAQAFNIGEI